MPLPTCELRLYGTQAHSGVVPCKERGRGGDGARMGGLGPTHGANRLDKLGARRV